jgi:hypothetical protein
LRKKERIARTSMLRASKLARLLAHNFLAFFWASIHSRVSDVLEGPGRRKITHKIKLTHDTLLSPLDFKASALCCSDSRSSLCVRS